MSITDIRPSPSTPAYERIASVADNRLGAVYSALYSFWSARANALAVTGGHLRNDAYSAIVFEGHSNVCFENDLSMEPGELLDIMLHQLPAGGTAFDSALDLTKSTMEAHWNVQRCV